MRRAPFSSRRLRRKPPRRNDWHAAERFLPYTRFPAAFPRYARQMRRRIHCDAVPNSFEHLHIAGAIAVRIAARKFEAVARGEHPSRAQFRAPAHVLAGDASIPHARTARRNLQFGRTDFDLRRNELGQISRRHTSQRRQSSRNQKHTMTLRTVPGNALQSFVEKRQRIPAEEFRRKRFPPFTPQRFAQPAEITFVSRRSAMRIAPETSSETRKPVAHMRTGNL